MDLKIKIDASGLAAEFKEFAKNVEHDIKKGVEALSALAYNKIVELSSTELKSSALTFQENLKPPLEIVDGVWVITLNEKALWIEEGVQAGDMKPKILKGENSKIIPFKWNVRPAKLTPKAQALLKELQRNLRKANISYKGIERNAQGSPRTGKLHEISFPSRVPGKGNTPIFSRVNVYQGINKTTGEVEKKITTFRTMSKSQTGKWMHPGSPAKKLMDKGADWAIKEWEEKILPEILDKWK